MVLQRQSRELIYKLVKFMEDEASNGIRIPLMRVVERVCKALDISKNTVTKIKKEGVEAENGGKQFSTPNKKRKRKSPVSSLEAHTEDFFRRHIYNYYRRFQSLPTLKKLLQSMKDDGLPFNGGKTSLAKVLQKLGFR